MLTLATRHPIPRAPADRKRWGCTPSSHCPPPSIPASPSPKLVSHRVVVGGGGGLVIKDDFKLSSLCQVIIPPCWAKAPVSARNFRCKPWKPTWLLSIEKEFIWDILKLRSLWQGGRTRLGGEQRLRCDVPMPPSPASWSSLPASSHRSRAEVWSTDFRSGSLVTHPPPQLQRRLGG